MEIINKPQCFAEYFAGQELPAEPAALVGTDGWHFLCNDSNKLFDQYLGSVRLSEEDIEQYISVLQTREAYFKSIGIPYVIAIAPGKEYIYSEYLPADFPAAHAPTLQDQFMRAVAPHTTIPILDLRPSLLAYKSAKQLYYKWDSHWNFLGGYVASAAITDYLSKFIPNISALPLDAFSLFDHINDTGDLHEKAKVLIVDGQAHMQAPAGAPATETELRLRPPPSHRYTSEKVIPPQLQVSKTRKTAITETAHPERPRCMVLRDSYASWIMPSFSGYFSRACYMWQPFVTQAAVEYEKPDVVVHLIVDRFIHKVPPP